MNRKGSYGKLPREFPKLVLIEWDDAVELSDEAWPSKRDVRELDVETVYAAGWLIEESDHAIKIALQWNPFGVGGVWAIPRGMIKSMWNLYNPTQFESPRAKSP